MQTKIAYCLTCIETGNYIEQTLLSVFTVRHYNPDAHIVLLTDDKTDALLTGQRAELLQYINKKVVVPFEEQYNVVERSRLLKTSIRQHIQGDFLFIDSDTIITHSLAEMDNYSYEIAAVWESNLPIRKFHPDLYQSMRECAEQIDWDYTNEENYFSSGVIYCKDTPVTHSFFDLWQRNWLKQRTLGIIFDQPTLAKTNAQMGHVIHTLDNVWNTILFAQPYDVRKGKILHISAYNNPSWLMSKACLEQVRQQGLTEDLRYIALHPFQTFLPFETEVYYYNLWQWIKVFWQICTGYYAPTHQSKKALLRTMRNRLYHTKFSSKYKHKDNVCAK